MIDKLLKEIEDRAKEAEKEVSVGLDHPCNRTCSGWSQGFHKGYSKASTDVPRLVKALRHLLENKVMYKPDTMDKLEIILKGDE